MVSYQTILEADCLEQIRSSEAVAVPILRVGKDKSAWD